MSLSKRDWDVKIKGSATQPRFFRLLQQEGQKVWNVGERPSEAQILGTSVQEVAGLPPTQQLQFRMDDWSFGTGLETFGDLDQVGHKFRAADGFGIDISSPGKLRHGPEALSVGTTTGSVIDTATLADTVFLLTQQRVYSWTGSTLTLEYTHGSAAMLSFEVHGAQLYVAAGTVYLHANETNWLAGTPTSKSFQADALLSLGTQLWRMDASGGTVHSSVDPTVGSPTWSTGITVGGGEELTNMFSLSGLLFVTTEATIFNITSDEATIEMDKRIRTRRSTNAFTIKAEGGSEVWLSDGKNIFRVVAEGFEVFDIQLQGPLQGDDAIPFTNFDIQGTIRAIALDLEAVYVAVARTGTSDTYIYKGVEVTRNRFVWSPIIKSPNQCDVLAIAKLTGESESHIYFNSGTTMKRVDVNWTTYASAWRMDTPFFTASIDNWTKLFRKISAFVDKDANAAITVSQRTDDASGFTSIGTLTPSNGLAEILLPAPLSTKRVQLRFDGSTSDVADKVDLRSFNLEGVMFPPLALSMDFSVTVDTKSQADFLRNLRSDETVFPIIEDRFGIARTVSIVPGFPQESEQFDEILKEPVRTYRIVALERV